MALSTGTKVGPYEILSVVGAGGMGEVYRARDTRLGREVALKMLCTDSADDADRIRRFDLEGKAASRLHHPNILTIHDVGEADGTHYLVSELLSGRTLRERLKQGPLPRRRIVEYASQLAAGLTAAHTVGILHRDLKPENIFITDDERLKILDFGLAKLPSERDLAPPGVTMTDGTGPGAILGTAGYMAPEQVRGQPADHRADLFAFGAILYEMLAGRRAFPGETPMDRAMAVLKDEPPEPEQTEDPALLRLALGCLAKNPIERLQSARDLSMFLESLSTTTLSARGLVSLPPGLRGPRRRFTGPALMIGGAILAGAVGLGIAARARIADAPSGPSYRQLTYQQGPIGIARFAPDGNTVLYTAFGGEHHRPQIFATMPGSPEFRALPGPEMRLFSVSSRGELAVGLFGKEVLDKDEGCSECPLTLARMPHAGGAPRPVLEDFQAADWMPDGNDLAVARRVGGRDRVEMPIGRILYESDSSISHLRVSPRGDRLAFFEHPVVGDDLGYVVALGLDGKAARLGRRWGSTSGLVWSPSGEEIWFSASETGLSHAVYAISLRGRERLIAQAPGSMSLEDVTSNGRLLIRREVSRRFAYGRGAGEKQDHDLTWFDWTTPVDLSQDGKSLLFVEGGEAGGATYLAYLRDTNGAPAVLLGEGLPTSLSSDKKWVLFFPRNDHSAINVLPTGTGSARILDHGALERYDWPAWVPGTQEIISSAIGPGRGRRLYRQSASGGAPSPISPEGYRLPPSPVIAPDGSAVVAIDPKGKMVLYPLNGGEPEPIPGLEANEFPVRWAADERHLFVHSVHHSVGRLIRIDIETGEREPWKQIQAPDSSGMLGMVLIDGEGEGYVYSYGRVLADLFLMEGVRE